MAVTDEHERRRDLSESRLGEYVELRPTRGYVGKLVGSAAAVLVIGLVCLYVGAISSAPPLALVVGGFLALLSAVLAVNVFIQRARVLFIGERGFRDAGRIGDTGVVPWDKIDRVERQTRSLVGVYLRLPPGERRASTRRQRSSGTEAGDKPWALISCQGLGVSAEYVEDVMAKRLRAARASARKVGRA